MIASQFQVIPRWYQETKMDVKPLLVNAKSDFQLARDSTGSSPISSIRIRCLHIQ